MVKSLRIEYHLNIRCYGNTHIKSCQIFNNILNNLSFPLLHLQSLPFYLGMPLRGPSLNPTFGTASKKCYKTFIIIIIIIIIAPVKCGDDLTGEYRRLLRVSRLKVKNKKMKKFFLLLLIGTIFFTACTNKEQNLEENFNGKLLLQEVDSLSVKYITDSIQLRKKPKWWKVLGADLTGALAGAKIGAGLTGYFPSVSSAIVIGSCALVGAAGASLTAGGAGNNNGDASNSNVINNSNNSFEFVGEYHTKFLDRAANNINLVFETKGKDTLFSSTKYYLFASNYMIEDGIVDSSFFNIFTQSRLDSLLNYVSFNYSGDIIIFLQNAYSSGDLNFIEYHILDIYFRVLQHISDYQTFQQFSVIVENMIINSSLNINSKSMLLSVMATTRYDLAYRTKN